MEKETGGFEFALTLLAIFGSFLYAIYNYLQNTAVDPEIYGYIVTAIASLISSASLIIFYIFIKGYSLEVQDVKLKKYLRNTASIMYSMSFIILYITLIKIGIDAFIFFTSDALILTIIQLFIILLFSIIIIYFFRRHLDTISKIWNFKCIVSFGLLTILIFAPFIHFFYAFPLNEITVDMESITFKNDPLIPVLIQVTGKNTGYYINLSNENSKHNLILVESIKLEQRHNSVGPVSGLNYILLGNALENGRYTVFIETTRLNEGYYELMIANLQNDIKFIKSFYLLNESKK